MNRILCWAQWLRDCLSSKCRSAECRGTIKDDPSQKNPSKSVFLRKQKNAGRWLKMTTVEFNKKFIVHYKLSSRQFKMAPRHSTQWHSAKMTFGNWFFMPSVVTLNFIILSVVVRSFTIQSFIVLSFTIQCHYAHFHYTECHCAEFCLVVIRSFITLSSILLISLYWVSLC